jgi:hypothetical protein
MPEADTLDLTAQDVTEAAWDELACAMLEGEETYPAGESSMSCSCPTCDVACQNCIRPD